MSNTTTRRTRKTASPVTGASVLAAVVAQAPKKATPRKKVAAADGSLNLTTGELKVGPAKKATAKRAPAKKAVAKKAPAKKATAPASDKPKSEQTFEERDWTYLDEKEPSEQHVLFAKEINRRTNLLDEDGEDMEISPKQVQAVLAMFPHFQRSDTNKKRSGYRPLAEEIVHQRSVHMTLAHEEARKIMDGLAATAKKTTAKAPAKKTAVAKAPAKAATKKAAPAKRPARVTKKTAAAPVAAETF